MKNTIQYNTIQYNTIQYNTIQYNTIQYNTILLLKALLIFTAVILCTSAFAQDKKQDNGNDKEKTEKEDDDKKHDDKEEKEEKEKERKKWETEGNYADSLHFLGTINNIPLIFKTNNTEWLRLTPAGRLGLGTNNPLTTFDVSGNIRSSVLGGSGNALVTTDKDGILRRFDFSNDSTHVLYGNGTFAPLPAPTDWQVSGNDMYSLPSGKVGIGVNNPSERLEVAGNIKADSIILTKGLYVPPSQTINITNLISNTFQTNTITTSRILPDSSGIIAFGTNTIKVGSTPIPDGSGSENVLYSDNGPLLIQSKLNNNNNTIINANNDGRVGIGFNDINKSINSKFYVMQSSATDWAASFFNGYGNGKGVMIRGADGDETHLLELQDNNKNINFSVTSGGKVYAKKDAFLAVTSGSSVGIGTNPTSLYKLDVAGPVRATQYLIGSGSTATPLISSQWTTGINNAISYSGNVGIGTGTTDPSAKLHISKHINGEFEALRLQNLDGAGPHQTSVSIGFNHFSYTNNSAKIVVKESGATATFKSEMQFWVRSQNTDIAPDVQAMTILPTGTVGIGLDVPNSLYKLDVAGAVNINDGLSAAGSFNAIKLGKGAGYGGTYFKQYYTDVNNYGLSIGWVSDRLTINQANGRVGIGTTKPEANLHISGAGDQWMDIGSTTDIGGTPGNNSYTRLISVASNGKVESRLQYNGRFSFVTPLSSGTTKMLIDENGNVGIGRPIPQAKLDVKGTALFSEKVEIGTTTGSNGADYLALQVNGSISIHDGNGNTSLFFGKEHILPVTSTTQGEWGIQYATTSDITANPTGHGLNFWKPSGSTASKNYYLFLKDDNGYVGINNGNPKYNLDVAGKVNADEYLVKGKALATSQWANGTGNINYNAGKVGIGTDIPSAYLEISKDLCLQRVGGTPCPNYFQVTKTGIPTYDGTSFTTTSSTLFVVEDTGSVGIGVANPANKLDVAGGVAIGYSYAGNNLAPGNGLIVQGNVGIGTSVPHFDNKLEVINTIGLWSGNTNYPVKAQLEQNGNHFYMGENIWYGKKTPTGTSEWNKFDDNNGTSQIRLANNHSGNSNGGGGAISFYTGSKTDPSPGIERMVIDEKGNVGIGTSSPDATYKLSVNGGIRAKKVVVSTTWSDFVFEKNYKLKTLKEVEQYIQQNGHLSEIPTAKEIEANGADFGELLKLQMQKIEELTLYVIEQNRKIEELERRIQNKN